MKKLSCVTALLLTPTGCSALAQSVTVTFYDMGGGRRGAGDDGKPARAFWIRRGHKTGGRSWLSAFGPGKVLTDRPDGSSPAFDKDHVGGAE